MEQQRRRKGRPSKLSYDLQRELVALLRAGNYIETSARMLGLDPQTVHAWLQRGARARGVTDQEYAAFSEAVRKAQAEAEVRDLRRIERAAGRTWKAAAWRLERRHSRRWGPKVQLMVEEALGALLDHLEATLDASTYDRVLEAARAWDGEAGREEPEE